VALFGMEHVYLPQSRKQRPKVYKVENEVLVQHVVPVLDASFAHRCCAEMVDEGLGLRLGLRKDRLE